MEKLNRYQLTFYVPSTHKESVKEALFLIGAGIQGNYEQTCWECLGTGQFRPLSTANPTIGEREELCHVEEYKVEMLCKGDKLSQAIDALKSAHPYEEPAYSLIKLENY